MKTKLISGCIIVAGLLCLLACSSALPADTPEPSSIPAPYEDGQENNSQERQGKVKQGPEPQKQAEEPIGKVEFIETELLGRPTDRSVTVNVVADKDLDVFFEYGIESGTYNERTNTAKFQDGSPVEMVIDQLQPNTRYYYRMRYCQPGESEFSAGEEYTFHTQRPPGSTFTFTVQADSHRDENSNDELYKITLFNILTDNPDFHIDLGDTFMTEKFAESYQEVVDRYIEERLYFGVLSHSIPLFLVNGNHEGEQGRRLNGTPDNLAIWATKARKLYYLNPTPDDFYTGCEKPEDYVGLRENYYSWNWGDALFIVLDPYWYTSSRPKQSNGNWNRTLGYEQYTWLKHVLENSPAKYKFIFAHQLVGGLDTNGRGGTEVAGYYEWGGLNQDGSWGFDENRPGWGKPIHQMMVENNVTIFFHGHDHFFAKQELDGIVYQLVPQPSVSRRERSHATEYGYIDGVFLPSSGHLRITISEDRVTVDYVRAYLTENEKGGRRNEEVAYSYVINGH